MSQRTLLTISGSSSVRFHFSIMSAVIERVLHLDQRVLWLRTKARRDRWREEVILLRSELLWTRLYFDRMAAEWKGRASAAGAEGHKAYANRQRAHWEALSFAARRAGDGIV